MVLHLLKQTKTKDMRQLNTKEGREAARQYQFTNLESKGAKRIDVEGYTIFYWSESGKFYCRYWIGTAANHADYRVYRTENELLLRVEQLKETAISRKQYKAEQKEKNKGHKSSHAAAAAAIRVELKESFPNVKFKVTSDSFSMGDSVHVSWTDGPTARQVDEIVKKYQYGRFNGMEDIYEYTNNREDIPQAKYVQTGRSISEAINEAVETLIDEKFNNFTDHEKRVQKNRILSDCGIPLGATVEGIEYSQEKREFVLILAGGQSEQKTNGQPNIEPVTVEAGKVQVIAYGEKAIAVIGDTKPIKDVLKAAGGRFNFRLSCGAGWVFPKSKLDDVKSLLLAQKSKTEVKDEVCKMIQLFADIDTEQTGEISESVQECARVQNVAIRPCHVSSPFKMSFA